MHAFAEVMVAGKGQINLLRMCAGHCEKLVAAGLEMR
jgi:hypothetical protein